MKTVSAYEAKSRFGKLLDTARRGPVTIEKHGRPVAVLLSKEEFDEIEAMKLEHLRGEVRKGIEDLERGDFVEVDEEGLDELVEDIMSGKRKREL